MATSSFGATAAAAASSGSVSKNAPKVSAYSQLCHPNYHGSNLSFRLSPKPNLLFISKGMQSSCNRPVVVKAQLNEVSADGSSNAAPKLDEATPKAEDVKPSNEPPLTDLASDESVSEFITQVKSLIKLVDSRDIVELELKQLDYELVIRKKEALLPPPSSQVVMMQQPYPVQSVASAGPPPASSPAPAAAPSPAPAPAALPAAKSSKSSHPPLKCPMAGTFYRSPAPGEPPFVKVGDKVQKGQVICIIEAMKLMNEIEADQSGTIVEIIAEDGKPVSIDTPLLVIQP